LRPGTDHDHGTQPITFRHDQPDGDDLAIADLHEQNVALRAELHEVEPVISAAVLAATAFRLRDSAA
jgi:hypothetical protein